MRIISSALRLAWSGVVVAFISAQAPIASALIHPAIITGEVRVIPPERSKAVSGHPKKHTPQEFEVKVPLTIENVQSEKVVRRKTIMTDTKFVLSIAPGSYRVSAQIGAPLVGPRPKKCGPQRRVDARSGRQVFVSLLCVVV